jgi:hypothetical protein
MLIALNILSAVLVLPFLINGGWFGEKLQAKMVLDVNSQYDRELLMMMAQVQAGNGRAIFNSEGMIQIETDQYRFKVYADDYNSEKFGQCYVKYTFFNNKESYKTEVVRGDLTLDTRKYLVSFKEEFLGIKDISSARKGFSLKKEKVTIE